MDLKLLPIPPPPPTQALSSNTFRPPPLDGSLTYPELYDWHLENTPTHPLFVYSDHGEVKTLFWPEVVRAVHKAGSFIRSVVSTVEDASAVPESPAVVAMLSASDTITYFTTMVGIVRAGHIAFPISIRNSPAAVAHLLTKTNTTHVLVGSEASLQSLAAASLELISEAKPQLTPMPNFNDLYVPNSAAGFTPLSFRRPDFDSPAIILHSSGSTAFPKPVTWSHYHMLQVAIRPWYGNRDLTSVHLAIHSVPMFHGMGMMMTAWSASTGIVLTCFKPQSPAVLPSPDTVLVGAKETESNLLFCVPSFIEAWAKEENAMAFLQTLDAIVYAGGPLNKAVGDSLCAKGVTICTFFGSTESGIYNIIFPSHVDKDWDYFTIADCIKARFISDGQGSYEIVIEPHIHVIPCVLNSEIEGRPVFATGDLLTPHPTKAGFWTVFGRADDQIMHSTGEKTNPGPLETILNQDRHVQSAVMFGRGRFNAGVIIDPKPEFKFDPSDTEALADFRQKLWSSIERLNQYAPQHSRLFKEMIMVSKPSKPFTYTAKNTARRQVVIKDYEPEIEELYDNVEETTQPGLWVPSDWSSSQSLEFVRAAIFTVLKHKIGDEDDIFQNGCDSLQAMWIRNSLLRGLRATTNVDTRNISIAFVYNNPTIASLAKFMTDFSKSSGDISTSKFLEAKIKEMEAMVLKYSEDFPPRTASLADGAKSEGTVVLLTGSTGGLGSALLAKLLLSTDVTRVYALNRPAKTSLSTRQDTAFEERGLDLSLLSSQKLVLLEGDTTKQTFGLDGDEYEEILETVTHIFHNAYTVNFNLSLMSFEPNVRSLRNLINFALSSHQMSPPHLLFTSSVGAVRNFKGSGPVEETYVDAAAAVGSGYSESKWVCESILSKVSQATSLQATTIRIGQLSGMSGSGHWTEKEWVPSLVKSSVRLGCLPRIDGDVSWIPIDVAAQVIVEMRDTSAQVLHICNPKSAAWNSLFDSVSQSLNLRMVPYSEWLSALNEAAALAKNSSTTGNDLNENPALKLVDFFRTFPFASSPSDSGANGGTGGDEAMGLKRLSLRESMNVSESLRNCSRLTADDAKKWLECWKLINNLSN